MSRSTTRSVLVLALLTSAPAAAQNELLYYKFDEVGAGRVANYYSETGLAPREGTITTTDVSAFEPGRFGAGALRGSNTGGTGIYSYVDSGWPGAFSGDFTVAFWIKQRNLPSGATYLFGNPVGLGFRCFTGGAAGRGLRVTSAGTNPLNLDVVQDVQTMAQAGWVHAALTVDTSRTQAVWWLNGASAVTIPLTSGANSTASVNFRVGGQLSNSPYDLDDFRFLLRAATPNEIASWALRNEARDTPYGLGCGAQLVAAGGEPRIGNASYRVDVGGIALSPFLLSVGSSRSNLGGFPLPLDLGVLFPVLAGCGWESDLYFMIGAMTDAQGGASIPLAIPPDVTLSGASFYSQALLLLNGAEQSSNGIASSLGF